MLKSSDWRRKATDYAIKAHKITDAELRRQYAELSARYLGVANQLEHLAVAADRPNVTSQDRV